MVHKRLAQLPNSFQIFIAYKSNVTRNRKVVTNFENFLYSFADLVFEGSIKCLELPEELMGRFLKS